MAYLAYHFVGEVLLHPIEMSAAMITMKSANGRIDNFNLLDYVTI